VCKQEGHQNNATYLEEREVWDERAARYRPVRTEKFLHAQRDGQVSNVQRNAMGAITNGPADHYTIVSRAWAGVALQGQVFVNASSACKALKEAIKADASFAHGSQWQGEPLYPRATAAAAEAATSAADTSAAGSVEAPLDPRLARRTESRLPCLSRFPASAPAGAFLAHLDAAGAPRSYGRHYPYYGGTKGPQLAIKLGS
jgi:hypothetical protein